MNYRPSLRASIALIAMAGAWPAQAEDDVYARAEAETKIVTTALEDGYYRTHVPLAAIRAAQGGMRLEGAAAGETLSVAIAPQARTDAARLVLRHATSRAQEDAQPHLRIAINGQFAAQVAGATGFTPVMDEIRMDGRIFRPGFNQLRLDAMQRYTFDCQDPTAAELWTEVDTQRSALELTYQRRRFTGTLADLDKFMSPGIGGVERLVIVTGGDKPADKHLRWGALAAQAVANRMEYRLPEISRAAVSVVERATSVPGPAPGLGLDLREAEHSDLIVVGTFEELAGTLAVDAASIDEADGYLAVGPSPSDPTRFVVVASGHTDEAVERAVLALGLRSFPFAASQSTAITPLDSPHALTAARHGPLKMGASYSLASLGFRSATTIGEARATNDITFELPADYFAREDDEVALSLDFAYGASLEQDSVLNILVNGIFRRAIALSNPNGEAPSGYEIRLPARVFSPGVNVVRFDAELSKEQTGACATRNDRNLAFVLEDSTLIRLPNSPSYVELPNLQLMAQTGYPYSPVGNTKFAVHAAAASDATMAATWTLAARLGQQHGVQFADTDFAFSTSPSEENTILVGSHSDLGALMAGRWERSPDATDDDPSMVRTISLNQSASGGFMLAGENPAKRGSLLTVVTASTDHMLLEATRELVSPSHWSQLRGEGASWRANPSSVATYAATNTFRTGTISGGDRVAYENGRAPGRWVLLMGALMFGIAVVLAFVGRYMRRRAQGK